MQNIKKIIDSEKTVFNIQDLKNVLKIPTLAGLNSFLRRAKSNEILINICNGLRALPKYNNFELACKLKSVSYISLETVLVHAGVIFQNYENIITCISNNSKTSNIQDKIFRYSKIKDIILYNTLGIQIKKTYMIATPERALCDLVYLNPDINIENINILNFDKLIAISQIYPPKTILHIKKLIKNVK
jgi:hypothetical protein